MRFVEAGCSMVRFDQARCGVVRLGLVRCGTFCDKAEQNLMR
jgi:hypothetical protein